MNRNTKQALEVMLRHIGDVNGLPQRNPTHYSTISSGHRSVRKIIRPDTDYVKIRGRKLRNHEKSTRKNIWDLEIFPEFYNSVMPVLTQDRDNPNINVFNHLFPLRSGITITDDTDAYFVMYSGFFLRNSVNVYFHKD